MWFCFTIKAATLVELVCYNFVQSKAYDVLQYLLKYNLLYTKLPKNGLMTAQITNSTKSKTIKES